MKPLHELDAMCAQHVAGCVPCDNWKPLMHDSQMRIDDSCGHSNCCPRSMWPPKYMQNPAAVIELLEKWTVSDKTFRSFDVTYASKGNYVVFLLGQIGGPYSAQAPTFAKAGVLALLRARGVEVEG